MENLTSVVVMIEALLEKAQKPAYKDWAMITAGHAWNQLTDYAKDRVESVINETYDAGSPVLCLFEELKTMPIDGRFRTEREIAQEALGLSLYCFKAGIPCRYLCREKDGSLSEHVGKPCDIGFDEDLIGIQHLVGTTEQININMVERCEIVSD